MHYIRILLLLLPVLSLAQPTIVPGVIKRPTLSGSQMLNIDANGILVTTPKGTAPSTGVKVDPAVSNLTVYQPIASIQASTLVSANAPKAISATDKNKEGLFVLDATDTSSPDNGGTVIVTTSGLRYKRVHAGVILPEFFGAVGDSISDDTQPCKNAAIAATGLTLKIQKPFRITTGQVGVFGKTTVDFVPGSGRLVSNSTSGNMLTMSNADDVRFNNPTFRATNGNVKAIYTSYCKRLTIDNLMAYEVGILRAEYTSNILLTKPTGVQSNSAATSGPACIDLAFSNYVKITTPYIYGYGHGIQFWGGDGNPITQVSPEIRTPVSLSVARGCHDIAVEGGYIGYSGGGGFWGVMGENIFINGTRLEWHGDVDVDFEACINAKATNLIVADALNYNLSTFFLCDKIEFSDIDSYSTRSGSLGFATVGPTSDLSGSLYLRNVRFSSSFYQTLGYGNHAYRDLTVQDCSFTNVGAEFSNVSGHKQKFSNTKFFNTLATLSGAASLRVGNLGFIGSVKPSLTLQTIELTNQNAINSSTTSGYGIQVFHLNNQVDEVMDNVTTRGYQLDVVLQPQSTTNTALQATVRFTNNTFGSGTVYVTPPTGSNIALNVVTENGNNRNLTGALIGNNATYSDILKTVRGSTDQSRSGVISTGAIGSQVLPSGMYAVLPAVTGMPVSGHNWILFVGHHEDNSGPGGGTWAVYLAIDLITPGTIYVGGRNGSGVLQTWVTNN